LGFEPTVSYVKNPKCSSVLAIPSQSRKNSPCGAEAARNYLINCLFCDAGLHYALDSDGDGVQDAAQDTARVHGGTGRVRSLEQ